MARPTLSLRMPRQGPSDGGMVLSEDAAAALALSETHGPRAGQVLVDEMQAAIRAGDDVRLSRLERVRVAVAALDRGPSSDLNES